MNLEENKELADLTTFKIGGPARYFATVSSVEDLKQALTFAQEKDLRIFVLGGGSNIVMPDDGFDGLVIRNEISGITAESDGERVHVIAGAGEGWDTLVEYTVNAGLYGIENLSGIPGSVGASPIQNIGAYGSEVKDTILWVDTINRETLEEKRFSNEECQFGYRDSFFKTEEGKGYIVTQVCFVLKKEGDINASYKDLVLYMEERGIESPTLKEMREAVLEIRAGKFPDLEQIGTAGSFFKNPIVSNKKYQELLEKYPDLPGYPVEEAKSSKAGSPDAPRKGAFRGHTKLSCAWILDHILGVKGQYEGPVGFFEKQPLVVVNTGGATAEEIKAFSQKAINEIKEKLDIDIEREVTIVDK